MTGCEREREREVCATRYHAVEREREREVCTTRYHAVVQCATRTCALRALSPMRYAHEACAPRADALRPCQSRPGNHGYLKNLTPAVWARSEAQLLRLFLCS